MQRAVSDLGQTIVMVTHDPVAAAYATRVVFLGGRPHRRRAPRPDAPSRSSIASRRSGTPDAQGHPPLVLGAQASPPLTIIAIVLGVAFMCGTFVLTDTLDKVFDDLFAEANANVDAQVQGEVLFSDPFGGGDQRQLLEPSVLDDVRDVDGVSSADPIVITLGFGPNNRVLEPRRRADRCVQRAPDPHRELDPGQPAHAVRGRRGSRARGRRRGGPQRRRRRRRRLRARRRRSRSSPSSGARSTRSSAPCCFGTAESSAGAISVELTLAEVQRLAGTDGRIQTGAGRRRGGHQPGGARRAHHAGAPRRRRGDHRRGGGAPDLRQTCRRASRSSSRRSPSSA